MLKTTLASAIGNLSNLPPMPVTAHRILQMLTDPSVSNKDLAQAVMYDPTMAAKTLQMANSAYYGLPNRVTSVSNAIAVLGRSSMHTMILTIACSDMYRKPSPNSYLPRQDLWRHALGVAMLARHVARRGGEIASLDEAFIAGLLHDVGKIVLDVCCPEEYTRTCRVAQERDMPHIEVERTLGPALHTEAGEALAKAWKLPQPIVHAIRWHHEPEKVLAAGKLPAIISAADAIVNRARKGTDAGHLALHEQVKALFKLDDEAVKQLQDTLQLELMAADTFLSLGTGRL